MRSSDTENPRKHHWPKVASMACIVSEERPVTLHHCHGGSMSEAGINRGTSQKPSDWLIIPLAARYHTGEFGIDSGQPDWGDVDRWEEHFGSQIEHLTAVSLAVGYNVFKKAGYDYTNYWLRDLP